ncbi:MAG: hypothetical protein GY797_16530, partial [Deltaproteobacteria bacterium]|nr:hypothetical protein [Deltaproteobacteria bacterium]
MKKHSAKKSWFTSSGYLSKRGETFSTIETFVKWLSWIVRVIPINRKKAGLFIKLSVILKKYRFTFTFRCRRLGILWSASAFPDLLTRSMMFGGMYQEDVLIALRNLVKPGDVVFD